MPQSDSLISNQPSIFSEHLLKPVHSVPMFKAGTNSYWPGILLFFVFGLYVAVKVYSPKKLMQVFASVFSLQAAKQLLREDYKLNRRVSVFLSIGFVIISAFVAYIANNYFGLILKEKSSLYQYLFFAGVILIMYLVKYVVTYTLSFIIGEFDLGKEYFFNIFIFNQTAGVALFPIVLCILFSKLSTELFLYPGIVICAVFFFLRLFRGFVISTLEQNIGVLYIFLYLCSLEILPLLVLIKFLLNNF